MREAPERAWPRALLLPLGLVAVAGGELLAGWDAPVAPDDAVIVISGGGGASRPQAAIRPAAPDLPSGRADLAGQLHAEPRDAAWAGAGEALIGRQLSDVPMLPGEGGLRVTCATTLCQATGWAPSDMAGEARDTWWDMVQGAAVRDFLAGRGLATESAVLTQAGRATLFFRRTGSLGTPAEGPEAPG